MSIALIYGSSLADDPTLVISARLADDIPLPAEMVLPLPENANVLRVSEFLGDQDSEDIPVQGSEEVRDGVPVLVFTLTHSRIGLADVTFAGSRVPVQGSEGVFETGFDLTLPVDAAAVRAAIALPESAEVLEVPEGMLISEEPDGNRYHYVEVPDARAGDRISLALQVRESAEAQRVDETVPWMVGAVAAIIVGAAALLVVTRRRPASER